MEILVHRIGHHNAIPSSKALYIKTRGFNLLYLIFDNQPFATSNAQTLLGILSTKSFRASSLMLHRISIRRFRVAQVYTLEKNLISYENYGDFSKSPDLPIIVGRRQLELVGVM